MLLGRTASAAAVRRYRHTDSIYVADGMLHIFDRETGIARIATPRCASSAASNVSVIFVDFHSYTKIMTSDGEEEKKYHATGNQKGILLSICERSSNIYAIRTCFYSHLLRRDLHI